MKGDGADKSVSESVMEQGDMAGGEATHRGVRIPSGKPEGDDAVADAVTGSSPETGTTAEGEASGTNPGVTDDGGTSVGTNGDAKVDANDAPDDVMGESSPDNGEASMPVTEEDGRSDGMGSDEAPVDAGKPDDDDDNNDAESYPIRPTGSHDAEPGSFRRGMAIGFVVLTLLVVTLGPGAYGILTGGGFQGIGNGTGIGGGNGGSDGSGNGADGGGASTNPATLQGGFLMRLDSSATYRGESWPSANRDEGVVLVSGHGTDVNLLDGTLTKSDGETSSEEASLGYGLNSAVLVTAGGSATLNGMHVATSASGSTGVFSYGNGSSATVVGSTVSTSEEASPGIAASDAGSLSAEGLTVSTMGSRSPAISAVGGGNVSVSGGTYSTSGKDSPAVSTGATVDVTGAKIAATGAPAISLATGGKVSIADSNVSGNASALGRDERANVILRGDDEDGTSDATASLSIKGGSLISNGGDMFRVHGADASIALSGVSLQTVDDGAPLLTVTAGKERLASAKVTASRQVLVGNVSVDAKSSLDMTLADGTTFTGVVAADKVSGDDAANGRTVKVTVGQGSTWKLTGDCTLDVLDNQGSIDFNGHRITLADGTVLK